MSIIIAVTKGKIPQRIRQMIEAHEPEEAVELSKGCTILEVKGLWKYGGS